MLLCSNQAKDASPMHDGSAKVHGIAVRTEGEAAVRVPLRPHRSPPSSSCSPSDVTSVRGYAACPARAHGRRPQSTAMRRPAGAVHVAGAGLATPPQAAAAGLGPALILLLRGRRSKPATRSSPCAGAWPHEAAKRSLTNFMMSSNSRWQACSQAARQPISQVTERMAHTSVHNERACS